MNDLILTMVLLIFIGFPSLAVLCACVVASQADRKEEAVVVQTKTKFHSAHLGGRQPRSLAWRANEPGA